MRRSVSLVVLAAMFFVAPWLSAAPPAQSFSISGTVTVGGAAPPSGGSLFVQVSRLNGTNLQPVTGVTVDASGTYTVTGLTTGLTYYLRTSNSKGLVDEAFGGALCINGTCNLASVGTGLTVAGANLTGKDFDLALGGTIAGTVTNASTSAPVQSVTVTFYTSTGASLGGPQSTNASGAYASGFGVPAGTYFAKTTNSVGLIDQLYSGTACVAQQCFSVATITAGTPITVAAGAATPVNFALQPGATITGTLTNAAGGAVLGTAGSANYGVSVANSAGQTVVSASTNSSGVYTIATGLPSGTYFIRTSNNQGFIDQLHSGTICPNGNCTMSTGTAVTLTAPTPATVNFSMTMGGFISGTISRTDAAALGGTVTVNVVNADNQTVGNEPANATTGAYTIRGLPTGTYFVRTTNAVNLGLIDEIHSNVACISNCTATTGTGVAVVAGETDTVNFVLDLGGSITGTITNASGTPVTPVTVTIVNASNQSVRTATTNSSGVYTATALPAGTYYARTANSLGLINEAYNNQPCAGCNATTTTPITVALGAATTGVDFELATGGSVSGTVTDSAGAPLAGVFVSIYQASGSILTTATSAADGTYTATGLPTGSVFARTSNALGYLDKLHNGIPCVSCAATSGTPISVTAGTTTAGINFSLAAGGRIAGTITSATTSNVLPFANLSFYSSQGSFVGGAQANSLGVYQSPGLPTGTYFLTASSQGFIQELYPDIVCPSCGPSSVINGTPVTVTVGSTTSGVNLALAPGGTVSGTVTEAGTSVPISGVSISLYNAGNAFVAGGQSNAQGTFTVTGLPSGTYYARTSLSQSQNYLNQVYHASGNLPCNNCNTAEVGSAVVVTSPSATTGIHFSLAAGGSISGTIGDGGNGNAAIASVSVQAYDSTGAFVKSTTTNVQGLYTLAGLPGGVYYLRTSTSLYVNQVFSGIACVSCSVTSGTPVTVSLGQTTAGRDFTLTAGGRIGGTVVSGATPLSNVSVSFFTTTGASAGSATTNASGVYLSGALLPGTYYARTSNSAGYVNEVYNNLPCVSCQATTGTAITVAAPGTTGAINFDLAAGGKIGGTITDGTTGDPLPGATASVYTPTGTFVTSATTNDAGVYLTTAGLSAGTYHLYFSATGYVPEVYNNVVCPSCPRHSGVGITVATGATTSGIDAALATGGRLTGRVTSDGAGVEAVTVSVYEKETGSFVAGGTTSASGSYAVVGLPAGNYVARTSNGVGYINEIYNDVVCATCSVTTGATIAVTAGATTANVDFALARGGRVSGTVRGPGNVPLASVSISVFDAQNRSVASVSSNQLGVYTTNGMPAGRYYVRTTFNSGGYINQLYNAIPCRTCSANTGTPVDVTGTATTGNIDFTLVAGTSISGTVRDASNAGLANVTVRILDAENSTVTSVLTAANGTYTVSGLTGGVYYARTSNALGLIDRIYNNVVCVFCSVSAGAPITVGVGTPATGIDFTLAAGGGISGTVVDGAGAPISGVSLQVYGSNGEFIQTRTTDALGQYATTVGLTPGNYYVRTSNSLGYIDEVYNNVVCVQCNPRDGAPVAVAAGVVTTGVDFGLTTGGLISGTVLASGGGGIDRVSVTVHTAAGVQVSSGSTNAAGAYRTGALPPGTYFVRTRNSLGYTDEVYSDRECSNCNPTLGNAVVVTGDTTTTGIDFTLVLGGRISGTVTATGGTPLSGVTVRIVTGGGVQVTSGVTDGLGAYSTFQGLPTGTYYAQTSNNSGHVDRIYNGVDCQGCQPFVGTPISVTAGTPTTDINFTLSSGGRIAGTITDATTSQPIVPSFANVYSSTGVFVTQAVAGSSGQYITGTGLAPGTYFVRAASRLGYISKAWNNVDCSACSPITGTPVTVTADTTTPNINFALTLGGKLSGRVTDADGAPLRNVTVQTYNAANSLVTTSGTDAAGQYVSASGLPVGTYYVRTQNNQGYIDEVYNNTVCIGGCGPNSGTAIEVGAGADVTGIDFSLAVGGKISGTVTKVSDASPMSGVTIKVYDSALRVVTSAMTDSAGGYVTFGGLPAGTYYVRTDNGFGYVDEVFDDVACIACDPRLATGVVVAAAATTANINFALGNGGGISGTITAADTGLPLGNVRVSLFNSAGSHLASTTTDAAGRYSGSGVSAGTYFLRTFNLQGYIDEAFDNLSCAPCNLLASSGVTVTAGATATGKDFVLTKGGLVSGYVTDATTNAPILGATVSFFSGSTLVGKARPTDENGYYAISLPVGTYTVLTDAINGYASTGVSSRMRIGDGPWMAYATGSASVVLGQETSGVTFGLAACTPPAFSITALPRGFAGASYSATLTATGGTGARTFSVADGTLPAGVTLNATTGVLSGTPSVVGTANFTLGVSDASNCSATQEFAHTTDIALTLTGTPATLRFAATKNGEAGALVAVTGSQAVTVTFTGTTVPQWTATSNQPWAVVGNGAGTGAGTFTVTVANPSNVIAGQTSLSATITLAAANAGTTASIPVTLAVTQQTGTTSAPVGQVDTPVQPATGLQGAIGMTGWVVDDVGVANVRLYRQCLSFEATAIPSPCVTVLGTSVVLLGDASVIPGARPDVEAVYPTLPAANSAGWGFLILSNLLPNIATQASGGGVGTFILYAVATDQEGNQRMLGRTINDTTPTTVTVANDSIAKPFGAIDTPTQGQTVSGTLNNFGWAITPDSNTVADGTDILVPTAGTSINVIVDGVSLGTATYNLCRGPIAVGGVVPAGQLCDDDVSGIFRGAGLYRNLDAGRGPIALRTISTTALTNGLHTIQWGVSDSASRGEGIGSRYFNVLNSASDVSADLGTSGLRDLASKPVADVAVYGRSGFSFDRAYVPVEAVRGIPSVVIPELGRVELQVPGAKHVALLANGQARSAPVGMSVDEESGMVRWSVGPGYLGTYRLSVAVRSAQCASAECEEQVLIDVTVAPMAHVEEPVRMHLDSVRPPSPRLRRAGSAPGTPHFALHGWALDPQAETGSGIGAVHVWATRRSAECEVRSAGCAPIFLGTADMGVSRPDVAAAHGARFPTAGFSFQGALGEGEWEITAFIWNSRTGRFEDARTVNITVK